MGGGQCRQGYPKSQPCGPELPVSSCDPSGNSGRGCPAVFLNSKYFANLWGGGGALGTALPIASEIVSWDFPELWTQPFSWPLFSLALLLFAL